jgi:hypothetical protein
MSDLFPDNSYQSEFTAEEVAAQWKGYCMKLCREGRDALLAQTDYIHMPDVSVSAEYEAAINTYRQELRDFPEVFSALFDSMTDVEKEGVTPQSIPFPTKP